MRFVPSSPAQPSVVSSGVNEKNLLRYQISKLEKALLLATLQIFPALNTAYHRITRNPENGLPDEQRLLEEAMDRQNSDHKARVTKFINSDGPAFEELGDELYLNLTGEEVEWLLQVLNDIRVGSWVRLGSPESDTVRRNALSPEEARAVAAMDMSAYFQSGLLEAFK
jgi:hypothetical protein